MMPPLPFLAACILAFAPAVLADETNQAAAADVPVATNAPAPAAAPASGAMAELKIQSHSFHFDPKSRVAVYMGSVLVQHPEMKLTLSCDLMTARVPESGKPDNVVAEQHVTIDAVDNQGKPVHAKAGKAVYTCRTSNSVTNEYIVLSEDSPEVEREGSSLTGTTITWDLVSGSFSATDPRMIIKTAPMVATNLLAHPAAPAPK
ncbi:MAG: LptA/OstA family protein [Verrucomicrobiota bacterium]